MNLINIREIQVEDASLVCRFAAALNEHFKIEGPSLDPEVVRALLVGSHRFLFGYIAERDAKPVGYVLCQDFFDTDTGCMATWVLDLYVEAESRGRGTGTELLRRVAAAAVAGGRRLVSLAVYRSNPARRLYERIGAAMPEEALLYELRDEHLLDFLNSSNN